MAQILKVHPEQPQLRLIRQVVSILQLGGVIAYPTDSAYALGCKLGEKAAMEKIIQIRRLDKKHNFTLVCHDLSEISSYALVSNLAFRKIKATIPGPYTFILPASRDVPRRLQNEKRKTIGIRVPNNAVTQALLEELHEPLVSVTLIMPGEKAPLSEAEEINNKIGKQIDIIIDGGACGSEPTTMVDFVSEIPVILRVGKGDPKPFR